MKIKSIIALTLCLMMVLSMAACGGDNTNTPADTTTAATPDTTTAAPAADTTTATPEETTAAPVDTTAAPADTTTAAPADTTPVAPLAPIEFGDLSDADKNALKSVMPATLPDGSAFEIACRTMCFDRGEEDYLIEGNSRGSATYVDDLNGAIFGKAIKINACDDGGTKRTEIQVCPFEDVITLGCKGILFYVDFSNVVPTGEPDKMCTSVTINTNDWRSQGPEKATGSGIGYYYLDGAWVQTTNITACRMQIPDNFAGWVYVPATSYYDVKNGKPLEGDTFGDIFVLNMRCYTDGYVYSADNYIIFDEITFVK